MKKFIIPSLLIVFQIHTLIAQESEVLKTAKGYCHSANNFYVFKNDEALKSKLDFKLSEIFDYDEGVYYVSGIVNTIMISPSVSIEIALEKAAKYFEQTGQYTFASRGQSRTMFKDDKAIYRFYPYKDVIVFEIF